jgi:hypothetical protein
VDIDSGQKRWRRGVESNVRFLHRLTGGGPAEGVIFRFHVASWQKPAMQAVVVHEEHEIACGVEHERGAGDVSGVELVP